MSCPFIRDCVQLIFNALLLCSIIHELKASRSEARLRHWFLLQLQFRENRKKDKMGVARVRYFILDDVHPMLKFDQ